MRQSSTHFAPAVRQLPRGGGTNVPPMVSVAALAGVSALVRQAFGDKVLRQANQAVALDIELIENQVCFIPYTTITRFVAEIERRSGEPHLGLLIAPHLSVTRYGRWGEYVLAADTLGAALGRAVSALGYHSRGDRMKVSVECGIGRVSYCNAARGNPGYASVASGTASVLLSLFRPYLRPGWRPKRIELDIPRPHAGCLFEDTFGCPVVFDAMAVSVCFDAQLLDRPAMSRLRSRLLTLEDVARAQMESVNLDDFLGVVVEQIRTQVLSGMVSIDSTARGLNTSVRTLQRSLHREGADFRELVNVVRSQRAKEVLGGSAASITEIATAFGYSTPANFARAFRKATGAAPQEFRARRRGTSGGIGEPRGR